MDPLDEDASVLRLKRWGLGGRRSTGSAAEERNAAKRLNALDLIHEYSIRRKRY